VQFKKRHLLRRSKLELYLDILKILSHNMPMKPTEIMYGVNVCYRFLELYLDFLVQQDLIERKAVNGRRTTYVITQKGLNTLGKYEELKKTLSLGGEMDSVPSSLCNDRVRIRGQQ
jgi:predicted transcriptional regulator